MADLKTLLGDDFKEGMTVEEINKALGAKTFVDSDSLSKKIDKKLFDEKASELSKANKRIKELEEAGMTSEEKTQAVIDAANQKAKEFTVKSNRLDIEKLFVKSGLGENEYNPILNGIVSEDLEKSKELATNILATINSKVTATDKAIRAELMKGTPRTPAGEATATSKLYQKEIDEAISRGDTVTLAAYMRRQQEEQK